LGFTSFGVLVLADLAMAVVPGPDREGEREFENKNKQTTRPFEFVLSESNCPSFLKNWEVESFDS
jgi:hypothetical protein